jgi:hypothetical protein
VLCLSASHSLSFDPQEKHPDVTEEPKKKEREPSSFTLSNPDRLIPSQIPYISILQEGQRYVPVDHRLIRPAGIVMLMDTDSNASVDEDVSKGIPVSLPAVLSSPPPPPPSQSSSLP